MKLLSWNVNGLRSLSSFPKKLTELDADIVCIQETRLAGASDPALESLALVPGYSSYFSFCAVRGGYSGVATFVRSGPLTPVSAGEGLLDNTGGAAPQLNNIPEVGLKLLAAAWEREQDSANAGEEDDNASPAPTLTVETFDQILREGRVVITDHDRFVLLNVYAPAESVVGRGMFKSQFLLALLMKTSALQSIGRKVVIAGDFNICPTVLDVAERIPPSLIAVWHSSPKRLWLRHMLSAAGPNLVDSFRQMHPHARDAFTCWSEITRARENNFGVRIDLILVERSLYHSDVRSATIMADVRGSDHCPVAVAMEHSTYADPALAREPPPFCAKNLPRFTKKQSKLFFRPVSRSNGKAGSVMSAIDVVLPSATGTISAKPKKRKRTSGSNSSVPGRNGEPKQQKIGVFFGNQSQYKSDNLVHGGGFTIAPALMSSSESTPGVRSNHDAEGDISGESFSLKEQSRRKSGSAKCREPGRATNAVKANAKQNWDFLLRGPPAVPKCRHGEACQLKRVSKAGPNKGRTFWSCARAAGRRGDFEANCNFFQWAPFAANKPLPD